MRSVVRRPEGLLDEPFLFALFCDVHGPILAGLDVPMRDLLLRQQFAGQRMSYRSAYPSARFDIVECDGAAAGRIVTAETSDALILVDIAILRGRRGGGIGTRLLTDLCTAARDDGKPVALRVLASNLGARRLYDRLGFRPVRQALDPASTEPQVDVAMEWRA